MVYEDIRKLISSNIISCMEKPQNINTSEILSNIFEQKYIIEKLFVVIDTIKKSEQDKLPTVNIDNIIEEVIANSDLVCIISNQTDCLLIYIGKKLEHEKLLEVQAGLSVKELSFQPSESFKTYAELEEKYNLNLRKITKVSSELNSYIEEIIDDIVEDIQIKITNKLENLSQIETKQSELIKPESAEKPLQPVSSGFFDEDEDQGKALTSSLEAKDIPDYLRVAATPCDTARARYFRPLLSLPLYNSDTKYKLVSCIKAVKQEESKGHSKRIQIDEASNLVHNLDDDEQYLEYRKSVPRSIL